MSPGPTTLGSLLADIDLDMSDTAGVLNTRHFPPAGRFQVGPRYVWIRFLGLLGKAFSCPCRKRAEWEDLHAGRRGQVRPHTPLVALDGKKKQHRLLLSSAADAGHDAWRFRLFPNPAAAVQGGTELPDFDDSAWDTKLVPSHWQLNGYEAPVYTNLAYPFTACPIRRPRFSIDNPTGLYRRRFSLPQGFVEAGGRVRLLFEGVMAAATVWLNGHDIGFTQDSGTPAEFDVTEALRLDGEENVLVVRVLKWCIGVLLEDQDTWWLNGIFRDVVIYSLPAPNAIEDYYAVAEVAVPHDELADATVFVSVALRSESYSKVSCTILDKGSEVAEAVLLPFKRRGATEEGDQAATEMQALNTKWTSDNPGPLSLIHGPAAVVLSCRILLKSPQKWSTDHPTLYQIVLKLESGKDLIQVETFNFGIRDIRIVNGQLQLNSAPLLINGVNRPEVHGVYGKAMPEDVIREDLLLLKRHNFNAVRCAHCPNAPAFYRLCDEIGLMVVDEANMENHGYALLGVLSLPQVDPDFKAEILLRVQAMFQRTKNHTCVIGWSLGNESGAGPNSCAAASWLRSVDHSRFVQYESGEEHGDSSCFMGNGRHPISDIVCPMYADPTRCLDLREHEQRPIILCEYSHAMGNSNGGLHLFYDVFKSEESPTVQGGFIWDFSDQSLKAARNPKPKSKADYHLDGHFGYGGDFGPGTGHDDVWFCNNGVVFPDRKPKPVLQECKYLMQPLKFKVQLTGTEVKLQADWHWPHCTLKLGTKSPQQLLLHWAAKDVCGKVIAEGTEEPSSSSHHFAEFVAALPSFDKSRGLWFSVTAELAKDEAFAPKGHVVAFDTAMLIPPPGIEEQESAPPAAPESVVCAGYALPPMRSLSSTNTPALRDVGYGTMEVAGANYVAKVESGRLVSLTVEGIELLSKQHGPPLDHAFWRAPTSNDQSGADLLAPAIVKPLLPCLIRFIFPIDMISLARQWRQVGLDVASVQITNVSWGTAGGKPELTVTSQLATPQKKQALFTISSVAVFGATGIKMQVTVRRGTQRALTKIQTLPRIGCRFVLQPQFSTVSWLGCGPQESYPDRKAAAPLAVHQRTVEEMHVPYIVPGESGGVADVQWAALQDPSAEGRGLLFRYRCQDLKDAPEVVHAVANRIPQRRPAGTSGAQFSATRWTPQEAAEAPHDYRLPRGTDRPVVVHLDTAHCGVGGTGGATEAVWRYDEQYFISPRAEQWSYEVELVPLAAGQLAVQRST